jgi:cyanophycin synthetase
MAAVVRREMPHVVGDGVSTIRKLVKEENKNPRRNGPTFHKLPLEKSDVDLDWSSVLEREERFIIDTHVSRYYGASTTDFTNRVHPENIKLFEYIGKTLDDSLVGIDFIIGDMERSWRDQKLCGVIEANSLPNIDLHHEVLYGKNRDIAGLLFDIVFE